MFSIVSSAPLLMRYSPIFPLVSYDIAKCNEVFPAAFLWLTLAPRCTKNSTTGICKGSSSRGERPGRRQERCETVLLKGLDDMMQFFTSVFHCTADSFVMMKRIRFWNNVQVLMGN